MMYKPSEIPETSVRILFTHSHRVTCHSPNDRSTLHPTDRSNTQSRHFCKTNVITTTQNCKRNSVPHILKEHSQEHPSIHHHPHQPDTRVLSAKIQAILQTPDTAWLWSPCLKSPLYCPPILIALEDFQYISRTSEISFSCSCILSCHNLLNACVKSIFFLQLSEATPQ